MTPDPVPTPSPISISRRVIGTFPQVSGISTPSRILNATPSHLTIRHGTGSHPQ